MRKFLEVWASSSDVDLDLTLINDNKNIYILNRHRIRYLSHTRNMPQMPQIRPSDKLQIRFLHGTERRPSDILTSGDPHEYAFDSYDGCITKRPKHNLKPPNERRIKSKGPIKTQHKCGWGSCVSRMASLHMKIRPRRFNIKSTPAPASALHCCSSAFSTDHIFNVLHQYGFGKG